MLTYCTIIKSISEAIKHPVRKIINLNSTIRVISPGLFSKLTLPNSLFPKYIKISNWTNSMINMPKENECESLIFPVNAIIHVTSKEKTKNDTCETVFRKLRML